MSKEAGELKFEEAIARLEQIVTELENGDVPLEQAIDWFQQGMELSRVCAQKLDAAERKIEELIEQDGTLTRKPFNDSLEDKGEGV
jgi:exodeoxyribonuclease VII small subunit